MTEHERTVCAFVLGVDPGILGGVSSFKAGEFHAVCGTPVIKGKGKSQHDLREMSDLLRYYQSLGIRKAYIEHVHSMPKQGVASSFNFGVSYGIWLGLFAGLCIPFERVSPQRWQKVLVDVPGKDPKQRGKLFVSQAFPGIKISAKLVDAFLIGLWGAGQEYKMEEKIV